MRRTVNISLRPRPRLPITTPANTWMRSLSPSTTLVWTRTESPTPKSVGFLRNCSDSILSSNAWFINFLSKQVRPALFCSQPGLFRPPPGDFSVVAREQHLWNFHPVKIRGPRVLRILEQPMAERLFVRTLIITEHAWQQTGYRI